MNKPFGTKNVISVVHMYGVVMSQLCVVLVTYVKGLVKLFFVNAVQFL